MRTKICPKDKRPDDQAPLDPAVKAAWVSALRSGTYKQGKRALRCDAEHFCCLGVFADSLGAEWEAPDENNEVWTVYDGRGSLLPSGTGGLYLSTQMLLASFNDQGYSFKTIADWIEKNL